MMNLYFRYGDLAPKTIPGKLLGLIWMLAGLIIITMFISIITAALTNVSLLGRTNLRGVTVSTGTEFDLGKKRLIRCRWYKLLSYFITLR